MICGRGGPRPSHCGVRVEEIVTVSTAVRYIAFPRNDKEGGVLPDEYCNHRWTRMHTEGAPRVGRVGDPRPYGG